MYSMNEIPSPEILHQPKILHSKKMYLKLLEIVIII